MTASNDFTHIAWTRGPVPERAGIFLVYLSEPLLGSRCAIMKRGRGMNSFVSTVGGMFDFDVLTGNRRVVAWSELTDEHAPMSE